MQSSSFLSEDYTKKSVLRCSNTSVRDLKKVTRSFSRACSNELNFPSSFGIT